LLVEAMNAAAGRTPVRAIVVRSWKPLAAGAAGFAIAWLLVDDVKMRLSGGALGQQAASLAGQMCLGAASIVAGIKELLATAVPTLLGAKPFAIRGFRMDSSLVAGSAIVGLLVATALALIVWRLAANWRAVVTDPGTPFGAYLALTGVFVAAMY